MRFFRMKNSYDNLSKMIGVSAMLLMAVAPSMSQAQSACEAKYPPAPKGLVDFIKKEIGVHNFLNKKIDLVSMGMIKGNCPHFTDSFCIKNGWASSKGGAGGYHFPIINGIYFVRLGSYDSFHMGVGRVLDQRYLIKDIARAIGEQIDVPPEFCGSSSNYKEYGYDYVGNCGSVKYSFNDKKFELSVHVTGSVEQGGPTDKTIIRYHFEDEIFSFNNCVSNEIKEENNRKSIEKSKESGKKLKLN